jgi:hypothetical protein
MAAKPKPHQTPFYKDPNIWTLLGVIAIQAVAIGVIMLFSGVFFLLFDPANTIFPFLAYGQFIPLPMLFPLMVLLVFVFFAIIKGMGERGKVLVRWTIIALALGSAVLGVSHTWQVAQDIQNSGGLFSNWHY